MSRLLPLALLILPLFATTARADPLVPSASAGLPRWQWSRPADSAAIVRIDLVRADVTIVTATDDRVSVRIDAEGTTEDAARIWIDLSHKAGAYVLSDRYPQRPPWTMYAECLPPSDERGDFWVVATKFKVVIAAPRDSQPSVTVKSGSIRDMRSKSAALRNPQSDYCPPASPAANDPKPSSLARLRRTGPYAACPS